MNNLEKETATDKNSVLDNKLMLFGTTVETINFEISRFVTNDRFT